MSRRELGQEGAVAAVVRVTGGLALVGEHERGLDPVLAAQRRLDADVVAAGGRPPVAAEEPGADDVGVRVGEHVR
jgi:hypothetical protein